MTGLLLVLPPVTQDGQNSNFVLQKQNQKLSQIETDFGLRYIPICVSMDDLQKSVFVSTIFKSK